MSSTHSYPAPASVFFLYYYDHNVWLSTGSDVFFLFLPFLLLFLTHFLLFSSPTLFLPFSYLYLLLLFFCFVFIVPPPSSPFALNLSPYTFPPLVFMSNFLGFSSFVFTSPFIPLCSFLPFLFSTCFPPTFATLSNGPPPLFLLFFPPPLFFCFSSLPHYWISSSPFSPYTLSLTLSYLIHCFYVLVMLFSTLRHFSAPSPQPCREEERLLIGPMDQEDGTMNELQMPFFPPQIPSTGYLWVLQFNYNSEYLRLFFCKFKQLHTVTLPLAAPVNVFFYLHL